MSAEIERLRLAEEECAREPVHMPGAIQPYGALLAFDAALECVVQVSANVDSLLGLDPQLVLGAPAEKVLGPVLLDLLRSELDGQTQLRQALEEVIDLKGVSRRFQVFAYRSDERVVVELEPESNLSSRGRLEGLRTDIDRIVSLRDPVRVLGALVASVRRLTGYQRVMVYAFDEDWNGRVIAEDLAHGAASYLDHRFPASDIPPQVRALYAVNRVRCIADAQAVQVPLLASAAAVNKEPLDLSPGMLRAAASVHCTYLANMGVGASMSVALHRDGRLWGLLACHHDAALELSPAVRNAAAALAMAGGQRLFLLQLKAGMRYRERVQNERRALRSALELEDGPAVWLEQQGARWLELFDATAIAMIFDDALARVGDAPDEPVLRKIVTWLEQTVPVGQEWSTRAFGLQEGVRGLVSPAHAGMLAVPLQADMTHRGWLLVFRPEVLQTMRWAGRPDAKRAELREGRLTLSPRASFESWQEEVRGHAEAWTPEVITAVLELGEDLALIRAAHRIDQLSRVVEAERAQLDALSSELQRSNEELEAFAYVASHDLQEPLRKVSQFSERLLARSEGLDEGGRDYLARMTSAVARMQALIGDLLEYSRVNRGGRRTEEVCLDGLLDEALADIEVAVTESEAIIRRDPLPVVCGDPAQLKRLFLNLLSNAIKYRRDGVRPEVAVRASVVDARAVVEIADNGIGIGSEDAERMFRPFVRLPGDRAVKGTGIGLAIARRIVERHDGEISAWGTPGAGTVIRVVLPLRRT